MEKKLPYHMISSDNDSVCIYVVCDGNVNENRVYKPYKSDL